MARNPDARFNRLFNRLRYHAPFASGFIEWVQRPSSRLVRIPLGFLLILGGVFSFLPVLGIWMLPLGLLILALDVPFMRGPVSNLGVWLELKWRAWRARRKQQSR